MESFKEFILSEGKLTDDQLAAAGRKIGKLTDRNAHTEALLEVAKLLGAKKYVKILMAIDTIQTAEKSMPNELSSYRYQIMNRLSELGKKKYGENWMVIHGNL